jgi:hypothetical protein
VETGYWSGSGQGQVEDSCECSNEPSGSVKREVLESLHNLRPLE